MSELKGPVPDKLEKIIHDAVCKELEKGTDEEHVASAVCADLHMKMPSEALCEKTVNYVWNHGDKKCTTLMMSELQGPVPDKLEKIIHDAVCKELEKGTDEDHVASAVCADLHVPKMPFEAPCEKIVNY